MKRLILLGLLTGTLFSQNLFKYPITSPVLTVATLPARDYTIAFVSDGANASDCTVGGGSTIVVCVRKAGVYSALGAGAANGTNHAIQTSDGAGNFVGSTQWTINGATLAATFSASAIMNLQFALQFLAPNIATPVSTTPGYLAYDTTGKNWYVASNSVGNLIGILPTSITPANNDCVKWTVAAGVYTLNTAGAACGSGGSGITQLTGDVLAGPGSGSVAATLATTGVTAATYGDSTHVGQFQVDAKGRIVTAANVAIAGSGLPVYTLSTWQISLSAKTATIGTACTTNNPCPAGSGGTGNIANLNLISNSSTCQISTVSSGGTAYIYIPAGPGQSVNCGSSTVTAWGASTGTTNTTDTRFPDNATELWACAYDGTGTFTSCTPSAAQYGVRFTQSAVPPIVVNSAGQISCPTCSTGSAGGVDVVHLGVYSRTGDNQNWIVGNCTTDNNFPGLGWDNYWSGAFTMEVLTMTNAGTPYFVCVTELPQNFTGLDIITNWVGNKINVVGSDTIQYQFGCTAINTQGAFGGTPAWGTPVTHTLTLVSGHTQDTLINFEDDSVSIPAACTSKNVLYVQIMRATVSGIAANIGYYTGMLVLHHN